MTVRKEPAASVHCVHLVKSEVHHYEPQILSHRKMFSQQ